MSLLDSTYFARVDCSIPQGTYNTITETIARYEGDCLRQILGYDLAKLVAAYANPGSDQRIIDIVEGKEYTVGAYTVKWNGLLNTDKISLLAYYCYIQWIRDNAQQLGNVGVVAPVTENGQVMNAGEIIMRASVKMRELIGYPGQDIYAPSLYNFLMNESDEYTEWVFNEMRTANTFDL